MYTVIRSKKIEVNSLTRSALSFCTFITNDRILLLFDSKQYVIMDISCHNEPQQVL